VLRFVMFCAFILGLTGRKAHCVSGPVGPPKHAPPFPSGPGLVPNALPPETAEGHLSVET
jgi:hypothetical protein